MELPKSFNLQIDYNNIWNQISSRISPIWHQIKKWSIIVFILFLTICIVKIGKFIFQCIKIFKWLANSVFNYMRICFKQLSKKIKPKQSPQKTIYKDRSKEVILDV
ncbi:hypothetical protein [Sweetwater Branch virus]|uniref:Uncharacterized protein n=1 Tax=Sweetwater Branch virus TaxID=1272958 RepID=A0A0D3R1P9_9RHAB|nr:hypothetical protein [Sweetwater Branch virus]AJR28395.1 hypothetical protein [Sweetwater Branch virus]